ncbi:hypothetical protein ACK3TF_001331 [Chlorella vulgaris]
MHTLLPQHRKVTSHFHPAPVPPFCSCLADGAAWTYNAIAECCSGYAFGAYCGCLPVGEPVQGTAAECCSRNSNGGSPDLCTPPCVKKNGVCEPCVGRRRSLQGMMELQCNCCTNLLCILNTTSTPICASNPSPPGIGEITATSSGSGIYTIEVTLIASNDTGAVGIDMQTYILSADIVGLGYVWTEYVSPGPSNVCYCRACTSSVALCQYTHTDTCGNAAQLCDRHAMTRHTHLGVTLGWLSLLLLCAHPCLAIPSCADVGLACSASPPPPPPPPGDCLTDGTAWTYDAIAECCSGYAFGAYCGCLPVGAPVQRTAVECCSRTSDGGNPDLCTAPCVKKSGACGCSRRRSLQGAGYQQCDCCADLLCADNSTFTGSVCAGPPSDPGFGEITVTETETNLYMIEILLTASNDTGAVGMDVVYHVSVRLHEGNLIFSDTGSQLKFPVTNEACDTAYDIEVFASNTAGLVSSTITYPTVFNTPPCCLTDGTAWTYDAIAECCSGYAFGAYCGCLPAGATVQATAVECCSRLSDGGSPDVCLPPCLKKSATCEDCRDRRRSLQGAGYQQCDCCAGLLCAVNTTDTGSVCAGPPSEPGLGEITDTEVVPDVYTLIIPVFASNDSGAVGIDAEYVVEGQFAGNGSLAFSVSGIPSPVSGQRVSGVLGWLPASAALG